MSSHEFPCSGGCFIALWVTMIGMSIILLILSIIFLWLFCNFYLYSFSFTQSKSEMVAIASFFKISSIISIIWAVICVIFDFGHIYEGYLLSKALHKDTFHALRAAADFSMFASFLLFYIYLYGRLITSFKGTIFKLRNRFKIYTIIIFLIIIILNLCYIGLILFDFHTHFHSKNKFCDDMHGWIYLIFTWFYMCLFLNIVFAFIYKLRELTIYSYNISSTEIITRSGSISTSPEPPSVTDMNTNTSSGVCSIERSGSIGNNPGTHIEELLGIVTKQTVLLLFSFILFSLRFIYRHIIGTYYDDDNLPEIIWMISYSWRDIVLLSNTFVIYLGFKFNDKQYIFCCKGCHKICKRICIWSMDKRNDEILSNQTQSNTHIPSTHIESNASNLGNVSGHVISINQIELNVNNSTKTEEKQEENV